MAQTTERLTAEFAEKGLKKVRRGLAGLTDDAKAFGDEMETSQKQYTGAIEQMEADTKRLQKVVEAQGKAFEAAMSGSAQQANAVADALAKAQKNAKALDGQGVNVTVQGQGGGGGASAVGGIANVIAAGAQLATIATAVNNVSSAASTVNDVSDAIRTANSSLDAFLTGFRQVSDAPNEVADGVENAAEGVQRLGRMASATNKKLKEMLSRLKGRKATAKEPKLGFTDLTEEQKRSRAEVPYHKTNKGLYYTAMGRKARKAAEGVKDAKEQMDAFAKAGRKVRSVLEDAQKRFGSAKSTAYRLAKSLKSAQGAMLGTAAAVVALNAKMAQLAYRWDQYAQQLKVAEAQSGVTAEALQETFFIARRLDNQVDFDTVRDGMKELAIRTTEALEGTGEAREAFRRMGIQMSELRQRSHDASAQLGLIIQKMQGLSAQERITSLEQIFGGEGGERFARLVGLSTDRLRELKSEYESLKLSGRLVTDLDDLQQETTELTQIWEALGQKMGGVIADDLANITHALGEMSKMVLDVVNAGVRLDTWIEQHAGRLSTWEGHAADLIDVGFAGYLTRLQERAYAYGQSLTGVTDELNAQADATQRVIDKNKTLAQQLLNLQSGDYTTSGERLRAVTKEYVQAKKDLEDDLRRGLITEEEFDQKSVQILRRRFEKLRDINQEFPKLDLSAIVNAAAADLKKALEQLTPEIPARPRIKVQEIDDPELIETEAPQLADSILPSLDYSTLTPGSVQGLVSSVGEADTALQAMEDQYESATSPEQRKRLKKLMQAVEEYRRFLDGATTATKTFGTQLSESLGQDLGRSVDQVFRGLGDAVSSALFGSADNAARLRLQEYSLQQQEQQLRESLRRREITQREYQLRMQVLQQQTAKQQEMLAKANGSVSESFKTLGKTAVQALKNMAAEMAATAAKLLVLKGLISAFNIASGGFGGSFITAMGGGGLLKSSTASQNAMAGPKMKQANLAIKVSGQFQQEGRGLTATVDASKQYNARIA